MAPAQPSFARASPPGIPGARKMSLGRTRPTLLLATALFGLCASGRARADCETDGSFSPCFAADPLWISAGPARLVNVAPAEVTAPSQLVVGLAVSHATHSVTLEAPSPDPNGRELPVVERITSATLLAAYGFRTQTELSLAIPQTLSQVGLGVSGISAQSGEGLAKHPLRDPRLGFAQQLWTRGATVRVFVTARYTLVIPLGNEEAMAGERGFVGAPSFTADVERGRWFVSSEIGARFRGPTRFANARLGSQLLVATGAGFELVTDNRLTFAAEAWLAPTLVPQPDGAFGTSGTLAPAEWLVSVSTAPLGEAGPTFVVGGGGGLATSMTAEGEPYTGITSPALRLVAVIRQPLAL